MGIKILKKLPALVLLLLAVSVLMPGIAMAEVKTATGSNASGGNAEDLADAADTAGIGSGAVTRMMLGAAKTASEPEKPVSLTIIAAPAKTDYFEGQSFEADKETTLEVLYDNDDSAIIDATVCGIEPAGALTVEDTSVVFSYTENGVTVTAEQAITVRPKETLVSIEASTTQDLTFEEGGGQIDTGLMTVKATYSAGTVLEIAENEYEVSPDRNFKSSDKEITITYEEDGVTAETTLPITVKAEIVSVVPESMEITEAPYTTYNPGNSFDRGGLKVKVTYTDGSTKTVTSDDYSFSIAPDKDLQLSDTFVTVSYFENEVTVSAKLPITVTEAVLPKSMEITEAPYTAYNPGNSFDRGGLKVKITYTDGSTKVITEDDYYFEITPDKNLKPSNKYVTIGYFENEVTVTARLSIKVRSGGSSSGGGSDRRDRRDRYSYSDGSNYWNYTAAGWQYLENGSPVAGAWRYLYYDGLYYWYYFDDNGLMKTGWLDDGGSRYYLYPVSDGWKGRMLTGWQLIDGSWYYFETVAGSNQGHMYRSERTPDGYYVGPDGVWDGMPAV